MDNISEITYRKNTSKFQENFVQNYNSNTNKEYIFQADIEDPKVLQKNHNNLSFLPEKIKIKKCQRIVCNFYDKEMYVLHNFKHALKHQFILEKVHGITKFIQKARLKLYGDMNYKLRTSAKNDFVTDCP